MGDGERWERGGWESGAVVTGFCRGFTCVCGGGLLK